MAGSHGHELVDFSDWLPTLAEIGGGELQQKIDGVSFASTLFRSSQSSPSRQKRERTFAFSEGRGGRAWVRTKQYKLYNDGGYFDVSTDAMEKHPLEEVKGRAAEERELLQAAMSKLNLPPN
jgi:arylsulfatase A-like enzyme